MCWRPCTKYPRKSKKKTNELLKTSVNLLKRHKETNIMSGIISLLVFWVFNTPNFVSDSWVYAWFKCICELPTEKSSFILKKSEKNYPIFALIGPTIIQCKMYNNKNDLYWWKVAMGIDLKLDLFLAHSIYSLFIFVS